MKKVLGVIFIVLMVLIFLGEIVSSRAKEVNYDKGIRANYEKMKIYENINDNKFGNIPLYFIPNKGQVNQKVRYYAKTSSYTLWVTDEGMVFDIGSRRLLSNLNFLNTNPNFDIKPLQKTEYRVNYFIGNDKSNWVSGVQASKSIQFEDIYPGVDVKVYGKDKNIEYDWILKPGVDPQIIQFSIKDSEKIEIDENGNLVIYGQFGEIKHQKPYAYQIIEDKKSAVNTEYKQVDENIFGFEIDVYDHSQPLVIDPIVTLEYSTYLGGSGYDAGMDIVVDSQGCAYVIGGAGAADFPILDPLQPDYAGSMDAFVTKFSSSGDSLVYSTYLGGNSSDFGSGITLDSSGFVYVTGTTRSTDFPTSNPFQAAFSGIEDVFIAKLNVDGSMLEYSTYLGGNDSDVGSGISVDANGHAYVVGITDSTDFPTNDSFQATQAGNGDAFLAKLSSSGNSLEYSTYLGGNYFDWAFSVAVDSGGYAYLTGRTSSTDFPTENPIQAALADEDDVFITKFSTDGTSLIYSTYLGGNDSDYGHDIVLDSSACAYITGYTSSTDFPVINYLQESNAGNYDVFAAKLNSAGNSLEFSTYLGGSDSDEGNGIALDSSGYIYITGQTKSADFPTKYPIQASWGGSNDVLVMKLNSSGSDLEYSTYLGGSGYDRGEGIAVDANGYAYIAGGSSGDDFPTQLPFQQANAGSGDAIVSKLFLCIELSAFNLLSPSDASVDQPVDVDLDWEDAAKAVSYDVYFGTTSPPPFALNVSVSEYDPGTLSPQETYYWQVTAKNACSQSSSPEWSFNTIQPDISGTITLSAVGLSGVYMNGLPSTPVTDAAGYYASEVDYGWSGVVTPALGGYSFSPASVNYTNVTSDQTQDYIAAVNANIIEISGSVSEDGLGLPDVLLSGLPGSPGTNASGNYLSTVGNGWSGTATPVLAGYSFEPYNRSYVSVAADYLDQDYTTAKYSSPSAYQVIPEALWAPATGGGTWMTEVQITDVTGGSEVSVIFNSASGARRGPFVLFTGAGAGVSAKADNFLNILEQIDSGFSYYGQVGALEFFTQNDGHKIHVIARTKNGDYSKTFPGLNNNADNTAGSGRVMMIQNLASNASFRTAYGGFNPTDDSITVEYELINGSGNTIGTTFTKTFTSRQYQAVNLFEEAGVPYPSNSFNNAWLKITPTSGTGKLMSYGATANNVTSDPAVHMAAQFSDIGGYNSPWNYQVIPEVLWAPATGGGTWMTEVQITDITGGSEISVYFNCVTGERRGPIVLFTGSGAGVSGKTANLLNTLDTLDADFSYYGKVGAVEFVTQDENHKIQVMARTSNGDYSKTFQGLNLNAANTASLERSLMVQNLVNDDTFRTALGGFNPTNESVEVEFTLISGDGSTIGTTFTKTFSGRQYQAFNPFTEAGVPYPGSSYANTWIKVDVVSGSGEIMVYGATANNITSDPAVHRAVQH